MELDSHRQDAAQREHQGRPGRCRTPAGFSMMELLSVIAIMAILTTLAAPSYRNVINSNRASAEVNSLVGALEAARAAAIEQGQPVTVCPSLDRHTCWANSVAWNKGWLIFVDQNSNAAKDTEDPLLMAQAPFSSPTDTFQADPGVYAVTFNREGFATNLPSTSSGYVTFTLHTQPQNPQWTRCVQLTTFGMVSAEHAQQGGCS
jgi:type IV fimbrial biogenesis protein FimT